MALRTLTPDPILHALSSLVPKEVASFLQITLHMHQEYQVHLMQLLCKVVLGRKLLPILRGLLVLRSAPGWWGLWAAHRATR